MNSFDKYSRLLFLLAVSFLGFIGVLTALFFLLKWTAGLFAIVPGFDGVLQFIIEVFPYALFMSAFYLLWRSRSGTTSKAARGLGMALIALGFIVAWVGVVLDVLVYLKFDRTWVRTYQPFASYPLGIMLVLAFLAGLSLASGTPKEKDWMERT